MDTSELLNKVLTPKRTLDQLTDNELDAKLKTALENYYYYGAGRRELENRLWPEYTRRGRQEDYQRLKDEVKRQSRQR